MIETLEVNIGAIPEVVLIVAKILLIVVPIMLSVAYLTLAERKVIGYVQVRIGPNRVGPRGLLQPIADGLVLADIDAGLLYILALTSMSVYGIIIAGWASNSKYAFLGALRSAAQV